MDGVIVDFDMYREQIEALSKVWYPQMKPPMIKNMEGAYADMRPIEGAINSVKSLIGMGWNVFLATKPPNGVAHAHADKVTWMLNYLPELKRKMILTPDKGLLGDAGDYLIDDRIHKANCHEFKGTLIEYKEGNEWPEILKLFRSLAKTTNLRGGT